jgi:hypothetical protein
MPRLHIWEHEPRRGTFSGTFRISRPYEQQTPACDGASFLVAQNDSTVHTGSSKLSSAQWQRSLDNFSDRQKHCPISLRCPEHTHTHTPYSLVIVTYINKVRALANNTHSSSSRTNCRRLFPEKSSGSKPSFVPSSPCTTAGLPYDLRSLFCGRSPIPCSVCGMTTFVISVPRETHRFAF